MDGKTFYSLFICFFAGVFVASYLKIGAVFVLLYLFIFIFLLAKAQKRFLYFACLIFFVVGAYRMEISETNYHPLDPELEQNVTLSGFVFSEPENRETSQRLVLKIPGSEDKILVSTSLYPQFDYGDGLKVRGILKLPENFETYPGGPEFDYISYLSKDDVRYIMNRPRVEKLAENNGNTIVAALIKIKNAFTANIEHFTPEPHASLSAGIILGEKNSLPKDLLLNFRRTGLSHILVLSGSNVSIVADSLIRIFSFLPRALGQSLGVVAIISFAIMTGASATTIRASIMALVLMMSRRAGRDYSASRAIILAGFLMLLHNPKILAFDIGFQLSFLSTLALIYVSPIFEEKLSWITDKFGLRTMVGATVSTQIFILPFIVYKMGEVSIVSLFANLLVLPLVPWSMFAGFLTGFFGFLGSLVTMPFALVNDFVLTWIISVVSFFGRLSFASVRLSIDEFLLFICYSFYIYLIYLWHRRNYSRRSAS